MGSSLREGRSKGGEGGTKGWRGENKGIGG